MLRAIIVVDKLLSVKRLKKLLAKSGKIESCDAFLNPVEAYEFAKSNSIHIAFVDLFMPEMNGFQLSSQLHDRCLNRSGLGKKGWQGMKD